MKEQFRPSLIVEEIEEKSKLKSTSNGYNHLIFIFKGKGNLHCSSFKHKYGEDDLFLFSTEDIFVFEVKKNSRMVSIQFDPTYFKNQNTFLDDFRLTYSPNHLVQLDQFKREKLSFSNKSLLFLRNTLENLLLIQKKDELNSNSLAYFQLLSLFAILEKTQKIIPPGDEKETLKDELVAYIEQNIYSPQQTQIKTVAASFHISINYFSAFFKRTFDMTYKNYIDSYRLEIIESRIRTGLYTMKQIAEELGFIDDSHLTHFFKKKKNMTPTAYKNQLKK
ncbi:AraC family transcriptional regulator [Sphingobacterium sp. SRCM116780]|uniref:helix-turn-helix domain-containing protein n=1 Tax=Sphingobacterium sp. SRCM116780 TaxID=2907623 RepID=UPI001F3C152E|nr:AraC family transcriptional regulator [Sphingobacterium sp. SRCM116780]UIR54994.1 AraC family transcriptional regulator [Sphingobacterium sp. SRCM116780]